MMDKLSCEILTSVEFSLKLRDHGCKIPTLYAYSDTRKSWKRYNCPQKDSGAGFEFVPFWNMDENDSECEIIEFKDWNGSNGYNDSKPLMLYSIMNGLCIRHAKSFFGDPGEPFLIHHGKVVCALLRNSTQKEAEEYLWSHCVLNPDKIL